MSSPASDPRQPKCSRCRHHGIVIPKKGHTKLCPFRSCECWKCYLITQRTRIVALHRNLGKARITPGTKPRPGTGGSNPAVGGSLDAGAPGQVCPPRPPGGTSECPVPFGWSPVDLRGLTRGSDPGGARGSGLDSRDAPPASSNSSCVDEFRQVIHLPFRVPTLPPSNYYPRPDVLFPVPCLPPAPAGFYNGFFGPQMFPHLQHHHPPPPEPAPSADCRPVFFGLQRLPGEADVDAALTASDHKHGPQAR